MRRPAYPSGWLLEAAGNRRPRQMIVQDRIRLTGLVAAALLATKHRLSRPSEIRADGFTRSPPKGSLRLAPGPRAPWPGPTRVASPPAWSRPAARAQFAVHVALRADKVGQGRGPQHLLYSLLGLVPDVPDDAGPRLGAAVRAEQAVHQGDRALDDLHNLSDADAPRGNGQVDPAVVAAFARNPTVSG